MRLIVHILSAILAATTLPSLPQATAPRSSSSGDAHASCYSVPTVYVNNRYGFRLTLPASWKGYTVLLSRGDVDDTALAPDTVPGPPKQHYTVITVRHPRWTKAQPYEDLPIMVFTRAQWKRVNSDESGGLDVSAAPFPPSELSRNARYVFALPPRYNYDYSRGWQELERIIKTRPLHGF